MAVTRSAGVHMRPFDTLFEAITAHATRAAEKLRQHGLVAGTFTVFFHTNRHRPDRPQHSASRTARLTPMTADSLDLVAAARRCAEATWPKGEPPGGRGEPLRLHQGRGPSRRSHARSRPAPDAVRRPPGGIGGADARDGRGERQVRQAHPDVGLRGAEPILGPARGSPQPALYNPDRGTAQGQVRDRRKREVGRGDAAGWGPLHRVSLHPVSRSAVATQGGRQGHRVRQRGRGGPIR